MDTLYSVTACAVLGLVLLGLISRALVVHDKIVRLNKKVDLILKHLEIAFPPPLSERVMVIAGDPTRKIEAIKVYRKETGAGLKEAEDAVEFWQKEHRDEQALDAQDSSDNRRGPLNHLVGLAKAPAWAVMAPAVGVALFAAVMEHADHDRIAMWKPIAQGALTLVWIASAAYLFSIFLSIVVKLRRSRR